jgi:hypothetical protein
MPKHQGDTGILFKAKAGPFAEATQLLAEDGEDGADSEQVREVGRH